LTKNLNSNFCAKVSLLLPRRNHNNQVRNLGIEHKSAGSATLFLFYRRPEPESTTPTRTAAFNFSSFRHKFQRDYFSALRPACAEF
jgi:hypothetical protein